MTVWQCTTACYAFLPCMRGLCKGLLIRSIRKMTIWQCTTAFMPSCCRGTLAQKPSVVLRCKRIVHGVGVLMLLVFAVLFTVCSSVITCKLRRRLVPKVCYVRLRHACEAACTGHHPDHHYVFLAAGVSGYRLKSQFKRYWATCLWQTFFETLLQPSHLSAQPPCLMLLEMFCHHLQQNPASPIKLRAELIRQDSTT